MRSSCSSNRFLLANFAPTVPSSWIGFPPDTRLSIPSLPWGPLKCHILERCSSSLCVEHTPRVCSLLLCLAPLTYFSFVAFSFVISTYVFVYGCVVWLVT